MMELILYAVAGYCCFKIGIKYEQHRLFSAFEKFLELEDEPCD